MSGRPTADIVADLRLNAIKPFLAQSVAVEQYVKDAADRLTELDAQLAAVNAALDQYYNDLDDGRLRNDLCDIDQRRGRSYVSVAALVCVSSVAKAVGR